MMACRWKTDLDGLNSGQTLAEGLREIPYRAAYEPLAGCGGQFPLDAETRVLRRPLMARFPPSRHRVSVPLKQILHECYPEILPAIATANGAAEIPIYECESHSKNPLVERWSKHRPLSTKRRTGKPYDMPMHRPTFHVDVGKCDRVVVDPVMVNGLDHSLRVPAAEPCQRCAKRSPPLPPPPPCLAGSRLHQRSRSLDDLHQLLPSSSPSSSDSSMTRRATSRAEMDSIASGLQNVSFKD